MKSLYLTLILFNIVIPCQAEQNHADTPLNIITDLDYGVVLYEYYQGNHQQALTEYAIIESKRLVEHHGISPELVKGGISLSYGLFHQANKIFDKVLQQALHPHVQANAWFYAGKLHYLEGNKEAAIKAFANTNNTLSLKHQDEFYFYNAQLALKQGDLDTFLLNKNLIKSDTNKRAYLTHNYILHQIGNNELSLAQLNALVAENFEPGNNELQALADRSFLALGYGLLAENNKKDAIASFEQITLDSHLNQPALFGYGWALSNLEEHQKAQGVFKILSQQQHISHYVREAMLGQAFSLEQLGSFSRAINVLDNAILQLEHQRQKIILLEQQMKRKEKNYKDFITDLAPSSIFSENDISTELSFINFLSSSDFNSLRAQLEEVTALKKMFFSQLTKLELYQKMLNEKQQLVKSRLDKINLQEIKLQIEKLGSDSGRLTKTIDIAHLATDWRLFLPAETLSMDQRITSAQAKLDKINTAGKNTELLQQRLSFLSGRILWEGLNHFDANSSVNKNELKQLHLTLVALKKQYSRFKTQVEQVDNTENEIIKISAIKTRISQQIENSQNIIEGIEGTINNQFLGFLSTNLSQLEDTLLQAKLAKIRIQDEVFGAVELPLNTLGELK